MWGPLCLGMKLHKSSTSKSWILFLSEILAQAHCWHIYSQLLQPHLGPFRAVQLLSGLSETCRHYLHALVKSPRTWEHLLVAAERQKSTPTAQFSKVHSALHQAEVANFCIRGCYCFCSWQPLSSSIKGGEKNQQAIKNHLFPPKHWINKGQVMLDNT